MENFGFFTGTQRIGRLFFVAVAWKPSRRSLSSSEHSKDLHVDIKMLSDYHDNQIKIVCLLGCSHGLSLHNGHN